ncbi:MAG: hypothetical protein FJ013_00970 [Chloroflexi bacterium]|nr:hypothetical protein [Chloroflexota bacterium]
MTGWYDWDNGKITASATGATLVGTWSEAPTFNPPDDSGDLQFNLSANGNSFSGQWRYGTSGDWDGAWNCTRVSSAQPPNPTSQPSQPTQPTQPTPLANWTGTWQCGSYKMYLSQTGNQVTGWYDYNNRDIQGYATGNTLAGTWSESQANSGDFQLTMSSDGKSFTGYYRTGSSGAWTGSWSCTRTSTAQPPSKPTPQSQQQPAPPVNWTGTWECGETKLYLTQTGNQVSAWFSLTDAQIQAHATGNTLAGTWSSPLSKPTEIQFTMLADGNTCEGRLLMVASGEWIRRWTCSRTSTAQPPSSQPQPAPVANWGGSWLCGSWGRLNLSQSGNTVTGTYTYQGGKFEGYAQENTLVGKWSEQPTYLPPDDAGDVRFEMSADGNSFTGNWCYGSKFTWDGTWNGTRDQ